jgi:hypothetical protein
MDRSASVSRVHAAGMLSGSTDDKEEAARAAAKARMLRIVTLKNSCQDVHYKGISILH